MRGNLAAAMICGVGFALTTAGELSGHGHAPVDHQGHTHADQYDYQHAAEHGRVVVSGTADAYSFRY